MKTAPARVLRLQTGVAPPRLRRSRGHISTLESASRELRAICTTLDRMHERAISETSTTSSMQLTEYGAVPAAR